MAEGLGVAGFRVEVLAGRVGSRSRCRVFQRFPYGRPGFGCLRVQAALGGYPVEAASR